MNHWSHNYIGLPYVEGGRERSGVDCWGLLCLAYRELDKVHLPLLPGFTKENVLAIAREIAREIKSSWIEVSEPQERDAVALSLREEPHHVGIWTEADGGMVLHAWSGNSVVAESIRRLKLRGFRSIKFYRHGLHH